ncbi:YicC family protein [Terriglobus albidus]|uniref:YicC family protein n=1 Tax=Terriglobus albidus TaxID=1592106 RepID=A0A5B9ECT8_9BACT|nr:YicC/YloC family endoribonuclease [Terriglobus albidus]QEE30028.1 YicC family protein [Terriglobus albidus]
MSLAYSMTGFARIQGSVAEGVGFTLSLKSVNHRFLDLHMRLPAGCDALEMQLRKLLKEQLRRGHVEVTLQLDRQRQRTLQYDRTAVAAYVDAYRRAAEENSLSGEPDLSSILRMPGVFSSDGEDSELRPEQIEAAVLQEVEPLIASLRSMRAQEGAALVAELDTCMVRIGAVADEVNTLRVDVRASYYERIRTRIAELTEGVSISEERLLSEAAIMAERSDVEEEIVRLKTHVDHFRGLLAAGGELGKKLDFLLQELNRESNTLLSKTSGANTANGLRITELGLELKTVIEKAREQVQNLE